MSNKSDSFKRKSPFRIGVVFVTLSLALLASPKMTVAQFNFGPNIFVSGNFTPIYDGAVTPTASDHTDFGTTPIGTPVVRTFTITNGSPLYPLNISGITILGANASLFTVTQYPFSPVNPSGGATFQVTYTPVATGTHTATINIGNNDTGPGKNPFDFTIQGTVTPPPSFAPTQTNPFSLADIGARSSASFGDLDNDGDLDMISGENGGSFAYYENIGTSTCPEFAPFLGNPFGLTFITAAPKPAFVDLDNDGDLDLMAGEGGGNYYYFQNIGTPSSPSFASVLGNPFGLVNVGGHSTPSFADMDNDGDLDMLSGSLFGGYFYFENVGSIAAPLFGAMAYNPFNIVNFTNYSSPYLVDLDNDGDFDLLSINSTLFIYQENTGTNTVPNYAAAQVDPFDLTTTGIFNGTHALADLDDDGDFDLMSGSVSGNFLYLENLTISIPTNCGVTTWTGALGTDWNTANNWSNNSVPNDCNAEVEIDLNLANDPVIGSAVSVGDLTITGTGSIGLGANLNVCGNITNGNTEMAGVGSLILSGASVQTIDGTLSVDRFQVDNTAGLTVNGGSMVTVNDALELKSGTLNATGTVVLNSDATGTAYLDDFSAGFTGSYSGNITIERYVSTSGFHHMGAAVGVTDVASQLSEAGLYGPNMGQVIPLADCSPTAIDPTSPYGNMFEWHEDAPFLFSCTQSGWFVRSSGAMQAGRGYTLNRAAGTTFDLTGTPNLNTVSYGPLGNTNATGNGFHMVSNPYPSDIEWLGVSGFDGAIYVWQSSGSYAGTYQPALPGTGTRIASQQAFITRRTAGTGSFSIPLSARRTGSTAYYREAATDQLEIVVSGQGFADRTVIQFDEMASSNWESDVDALKVDSRNDQPQIYSTDGYEDYSVNTLSFAETNEIPVVFKTGIEGQYTLKFNTQRNDFILEDKALNVLHPLSMDYTFSSSVNDSERFVIRAKAINSTAVETEAAIMMYLSENVLYVNGVEESSASISVLDITGRTVWTTTQTLSEGLDRVQLPQLTVGQYIINVQTKTASTSIRSVLN